MLNKKNEKYLLYAKELRKNKLGNKLDFRKKFTTSQKSQITKLTNRYESIVKGDYQARKVLKKQTLNILKNSDEIIIGNYFYAPKQSNASFSNKNGNVSVTRKYNDKRITKKSYRLKKATFSEVINKLKQELSLNEVYQVYVDGIPMHTTHEWGNPDEFFTESLSDIISKGKSITVGVSKF